jgi:hypothetical protein
MEPENNIQQVNVVKKPKLNPLHHLIQGVKKSLSTNPGSIIAAAIMQAVLGAVMFGILLGIMFSFLFAGPWFYATDTISDTAITTLAIGFVGLLIIFIVISFVHLATTRLLLTGVRKQKTSLRQALSVAKARFSLSIKLALTIVLGIIAVAIVVSIVGSFAPAFAVLLGIPFVIAILIIAIRLIYVSEVLVDDTKPAGVKDAINKSYTTLKNSVGATLLMILLLGFINITLDNLSSNGQDNYATGFNTSTNSNFQALNDEDFEFGTTALAVEESPSAGLIAGGVIFGYFIMTLIGILATSGFVNIYNDANQQADSKQPQ